MRDKLNIQGVANAGLFYVCHRLSLLGWNVMPTARNARGIDIVIYSQDAKQKLAIQVKSLSKRSAVPLGVTLNNLLGDFVVICRNVAAAKPECFILKPDDVRQLAHRSGFASFPNRRGYWLEPK